MRQLAVLAVVMLMFAGCISGRPKQESYTDSSGNKTLIQSDSEMCTSSCNGDYDRCMETAPASQNLPGESPTMFGAGADCRNSLRSCLRNCKNQ